MTHRGPFQPRTFCDSVICIEDTAIKIDVNARLFHSRSPAALCNLSPVPLQHPALRSSPDQTLHFMSGLAQGPMNSPVGKEPHTTHSAVAPHPSALEKVLYPVKRGPWWDRRPQQLPPQLHAPSCSHHGCVPVQRSPSRGWEVVFFGGCGFIRPQIE